jgi:SEL1 protein
LESLVILSLAAALAFLLYYRTQRQRRAEEARRQQQQQQANQGLGIPAVQQQPVQPQQEDRGLFPGRDDPEFLDWAAGAVGH